MDTTITGIGAVVVAELRAAGYLESTVGQYEKTIKALTGYATQRGSAGYSPGLGAGFASLTTSPRTGRFSGQRRSDYRRLVALFDWYEATGRVDLSMRKRGGGGTRPTAGPLVALDASWQADMTDRGLAAETRGVYGRVARSYLRFLDSLGFSCLDDADGGSVLAFLESLQPRYATTTLFWTVSNLRPFLTFTGRADLVNAVNLAGVKRSYRIVPVLDDDDQRLVVDACASGIVCARDAAITLLALSTGLRACDIVELRLGDIDWRGRTVSIVQQKTGNPLTVPLIDLLTCRLADYVLHDRPRTGDDHMFLRRLAPHVRLEGHAAIYRVTATVFRAAGVADPRAGTRFLRHNAASRMLRAATPLPTISAVLGHATEDSTSQYMNVDDENLLRCCCRSRKASGRDRPRVHQRVRRATGRIRRVQGRHGSSRPVPDLVFEEVRRVLRRAWPGCLRSGHRRRMGDRADSHSGPAPRVAVVHPRLRPVASRPWARRRLRAVRQVESRLGTGPPLPALQP